MLVDDVEDFDLLEDDTLPIVITGDVDHGKSTLIGRLLFETGSLSPDKMEEIRSLSANSDDDVEFAYSMDHFEEERIRGITIDTTQTFFRTGSRRYCIIDAPGHKEFLKNMVTGAAYAEGAVLIVDVTKGMGDQSRRHAFILNMIGIRQVIVVINKMDLVDYSESKFTEVQEAVNIYLRKIGIIPLCIIPLSSKKGINLKEKSAMMDWFDGPTFLHALDSLKPLSEEINELRLPVQDVYNFLDGGTLFVGRVESGEIHLFQQLYLLPEKIKVEISEISQFDTRLSMAEAGECIGFRISGDLMLKRGQVISSTLNAIVDKKLTGEIFCLADKPLACGEKIIIKLNTQAVKARIAKIYSKFDPDNLDVIENFPVSVNKAEIACVLFELEDEIVYDDFNVLPRMGRFVVEKDNVPVAGGITRKI